MYTLVFKLNLMHNNCVAIHVIVLDSKTIENYLLKNISYIHELTNFGVFVHHEEHVYAIFGGLPSNYAPVY